MSDRETLGRRGLFRGAATFGTVAALPAAAQPAPPASGPPETLRAWRALPAAARAARPPVPPYRFFNAEEAAFIEGAVDRIIPDDDDWPGALWAGVPNYIDGQLAGAYGHGARFYAGGPWATGTPSQGYQLPLNPSQLYRTSLEAILREAGRRGLDFRHASPEQRDDFLRVIESGDVDVGGIPSSAFFETFLANTIEGFLADPLYGGNRDMVGWRMIGFPGAYAGYLQLYTHHGMRLDREPMSIGQSIAAPRAGHQHG